MIWEEKVEEGKSVLKERGEDGGRDKGDKEEEV